MHPSCAVRAHGGSSDSSKSLGVAPEPAARFPARRDYLPRGCPMLKRVLALPGQTDCSNHLAILIDGVEISLARERDHGGRCTSLPSLILQPMGVVCCRGIAPLRRARALDPLHAVGERRQPRGQCRRRCDGADAGHARDLRGTTASLPAPILTQQDISGRGPSARGARSLRPKWPSGDLRRRTQTIRETVHVAHRDLARSEQGPEQMVVGLGVDPSGGCRTFQPAQIRAFDVRTIAARPR
jgi:hypothetical protein